MIKTTCAFFSSFALVIGLGACSSSPLGPVIEAKDPSADGGSGAETGADGGSTASQPDGGSSTGGSSSGGSGDSGGSGTSIACALTTGHSVWYFRSTMQLVYTCDSTVTSVAETDKPSFLTTSTSGTTVTFSGTAPTSTSTTSWSFAVNGETTTGNAASITTQILDPAGITLSISNPDIANNRNAAVDLVQTATLSSSWDGSMSDVAFVDTAITTDAHGLSFDASCASASSPYVCNGSSTTSSKTIDASTDIRWLFSAFDQGSYYVSLSPQITIESGVSSLATQTATFSIPIQVNGKVSVSKQGTLVHAPLRNVAYNYDVAISEKSTATTPLVSLVYFSQNGANDTQYMRLSIDRTDDPNGGGSGVTESTTNEISNNQTSYSAVTRSLSHTDSGYDGDWVLMGIRQDGTGDNVYITRIPDSATPAAEDRTDLTNFNGTNDDAKYLDMTRWFDDSGTRRFGVAYVRYDATNDFLTVAKVDPTGNNVASYVDDARYDVDPAGNQFEISASLGKIDRTKIRYINESGGMFYVAYRHTEDLRVTKLKTQWDASDLYDDTTTSAPFTSIFNDTGGTDAQFLDLALGSVSSSTVVGLSYRDKNGDCYFRRLNKALDTASTAVQLNSSTCVFPTIHWIAKSGKFVVTWGEQNTANANKYDIRMSEITLGTSDSASSPLIVADTDQAIDIRHLDTDYYADGDWMAVFYRTRLLETIHIHGFHVPGR